MSRLILVPQYPTKMRYQEWWFTDLPEQFARFFNEVIVLGSAVLHGRIATGFEFAPMTASIQFEAQQINEYTSLELKKDDVLLLCDISYPGLFSSVLIHKRPSKCFAICHATSKNRYDYFHHYRYIKYPIEKATAKLFNKVFVASQYHKDKLNWPNVEVIPFPFPPFQGRSYPVRPYEIVSVARPGKQKKNISLERLVEQAFNFKIMVPDCNNWESYYEFLSKSKVLLITSNEETFGYQVIDAIKNGCIPVAPNKFSYPELILKEYLYNNYIELIEIIDNILMEQRTIIPQIKIHGMFYETIFCFLFVIFLASICRLQK